jgi:hypothetical protein
MLKDKRLDHSKNIIKKTMFALGLSQNMETDPLMMREILKELKIDDFETSFPPMKKFLQEIIIKPKSLEPMFENIQKGLITKHPAIMEFLEESLKKKWLKKTETVKKSVQITFVLEAMTAAMCNSHKFLIQAENHYRSKAKVLGLDNKHITRTVISTFIRFHNFFKIAKILALDPIMIYFRTQRGLGDSLLTIPELKRLYKDKKINYFEYKLLFKLCNKCSNPANKLVRINIFEAGITEYRNGFDVNAVSAFALAKDLEYNSPRAIFKKKSVIPEKNSDEFYNELIEKDNIFLDIDASQDWVSLYITWNLAFILGNLENLDLLFPKLLMPSIINAERNNFLGVRVVSLWLSINHFLFRSASKTEIVGPDNKIEMAKAWSEINKKYAFDLAKTKSNKDPKKLMEEYDKFFVHSFYRLSKLVKEFFVKVCKQ